MGTQIAANPNDANSIVKEISRLTQPGDLPYRIELCRRALSLVDREHDERLWASLQKQLGRSLFLNPMGDRADNIDQSVQALRQALEVFTQEAMPVEWSETNMQLGIAYANRLRGDRADNFEQAINAYEQALEGATREQMPIAWAQIQNHLAQAYAERVSGERAFNLEDCITALLRALEVWTRQDSPMEWAKTMMDLGTACAQRLLRDREESVEQAIACYDQALEVLTPQAAPLEWAQLQHNLGNAYRDRILGPQDENYEAAIDHYTQALQVFTPTDFPINWARLQNNLATVYERCSHGDPAYNAAQAITHYQSALEVCTLEAFPDDHLLILRNLGNLHFRLQQWSEATAAYTPAIEAGDALLSAAYTDSGRQAVVDETSQLYANASYCLLELGQRADALLLLEQGKTRLLTQGLGEADLAALPREQQQLICEAQAAVRALESESRLPPAAVNRRSNVELGRLQHQARSTLAHLIDTVRSEHSESGDIRISLENLLALIPEQGALVSPLVTSQGGAVFVLPHGLTTITPDCVIKLDSLREDTMQTLLFGASSELGWLDERIYVWDENRSHHEWEAAIEKFTGQLWNLLVAPVHERLMALGLAEGAPVTFMPHGRLNFFPLHAAWRQVDGKQRALLDDYTVSFIPSASVLRVSQHRAQEPLRQGRKLLAVVDPTGDLPYAPFEGEAIGSLFEATARRALAAGDATKEAVITHCPGCTYLHFACHGFYERQYIQDSGLKLAGGDSLTLAEIISPRFDLSAARLVTLSACQTGLTDYRQLPNEYVGLATGFLQAGTPGVISTLWAVNDPATALLMKEFYRLHLIEKQGIAAALRGAQQWLRGASAQEMSLAEYYERQYEAGGCMEKRLAQAAVYYRRHPNLIPFSRPYYWAAFVFSGV